MAAPPRFSRRQRNRVLRFAVLGNGLPLAVATATNFSSHHSPLIAEERAALVRSYRFLLAAVRTDEATSRE